MRGGALPPGLLLAGLALALAFAPPKAGRWALAAAVLLAASTQLAPFPAAWADGLFMGCWISLVVTALCVHLPGGLGSRAAVALGVNAGLWSGAVLAVAGGGFDFLKALIGLLLLPVALQARRLKADIAVKTVASWLVALGLLVAMLPLLTTPGYVADHME